MDLNHVAAFVRVVETGSFTAAARALGLPKSTVSRGIAQLERDLGVVLLHRTTRKIHLTDAGTTFHERVTRALADIEEARAAAGDLQKALRGAVRLSAPADIGVWAVAGIVARFVRRHRDVAVEVSLTGRHVDLAAEGFDLAVRAGPLRDQSVIARRVGVLELGLYASPRYVARRGAPAVVEALDDHDRIALRTDAGTLPWTLTGPDDRAHVVAGGAGILADDVSFLKKAVLAAGGIALLPHFVCEREARAGKVLRVLPEWRLGGSFLHVVYPTARYVPHRVVVFRDHLVRELTRLVARCPR